VELWAANMSSAPPSIGTERGNTNRQLVKNTLYLTVAQALTIPLAMVIHAMMGRYLGPEVLGQIYLATTVVSFGFLAVEWGSQGSLPALVARDRKLAETALGSSFLWRLVVGAVAYVLLAVGCHLLGYDSTFQWALGLSFLNALVSAYIGACKDAIRGFERTDIPAVAHVGQQFLSTVLVIAVLILGGKLKLALLSQVVASAVVLFFIWRSLHSIGIGRLSFEKGTMKAVLREGTPFVFFALAMTLQPYIDALYLSKLAPEEVMGYHAVARRLVGVLLLPATAMIGALYPTLCRLRDSDPEGFRLTSSASLRGVCLLVVPVAVGCALYPDIGISIFGEKAFGPAEDNLRILSVFLVLVYVSMPLGTCILAAGKQRAWSVVQFLCVFVSLVLDPLLIPYFQTKYQNGGLGLCIATTLSELVVVACGVFLAPKGVFDLRFGRAILFALLAGIAMGGFAYVTRDINSFIMAPVAVAVYVGALFLTGGVDKQDRETMWRYLEPRLRRFRRASA
jgi:O-antigen/teichoic acid export membrane protein